MAVPKKKVSHKNTRNRYTSNNIKSFKYRKLNNTILEMMNLVLKKENWMPFDFLKQKNKKYKIKKIKNK